MPATFDPDFPHRHVAVSASTNTELIAAIKAKTIDSHCPYLLTASTQTTGRGQHGRAWQSPVGNVYLSLYYPLDDPLSGVLSLMIGYHLTRLPVIQGINRQLRQLGSPNIGIKWANDIGFYDDGHNGCYDNDKAETGKASTLCFNKLAGILIEPTWMGARMTGVVVGVGLNVMQAPILTKTKQETLNYKAISLSQLSEYVAYQSHTSAEMKAGLPKATVKPEDLYLPISGAIIRAITQFKECCRHPYNIHQFMGDYASVDILAGRQVRIHPQPFRQHEQEPARHPQSCDKTIAGEMDGVKIQNADSITGLVKGIGNDGSLRLQQDSLQPLRIYAGNITVLTS